MNIKTSKMDVIWSYLGYFFGYASNLIIVLFVMRKLSSDELGLWYSFLSVGALATVLDFGISNTLVRNVTYAWSGAEKIEKEGYSVVRNVDSSPNFLLLKQIINASKYICLVIALIALLLMTTAGTFYVHKITDSIQGTNHIIAWYIYVFAVFLNIYYTFWTTALRGIGAVKESQIATVIARATQIIVSIVGVYIGWGIIALSLAYFTFGLLLRITSRIFMMRYHDLGRELKKIKSTSVITATKEIFPIIWFNAKKVGLVSFSTYLIKQTTTIVCSLYLGLSETASYGLCLQIFTAVAGVSSILFQAESPMIISFKIKNQIDDIRNHLSLSMVSYWIIYILATCFVLIAGIPVIRIIKSETDIPLIMAIFMGFYTFLEHNHSLFATYIAMSNKVPYVKSSIISGIAIMVLSFLAGKMGGTIYHLMAIQCVVQLIYNNWKWPWVVFSELDLTPLRMVKLAFRTGKSIMRKEGY